MRADARLSAIFAHVCRDSPPAARDLVRRLLLRSWQIAEFPRSGRMVPDYDRADIREMIEGNYRIIYRIAATRIDVLTVMHCAQLLPSDIKKL